MQTDGVGIGVQVPLLSSLMVVCSDRPFNTPQLLQTEDDEIRPLKESENLNI
jgi:hypothetical protein